MTNPPPPPGPAPRITLREVAERRLETYTVPVPALRPETRAVTVSVPGVREEVRPSGCR